MKLYNIRLNLEWDEASQTYSVTSPDVPEMFTFGRNLAEIQRNVQEAVELLLEVLDERGETRPVALQPFESTELMLPVPA
ncbi:MAG TPA: type II toxin-antitoxin system HicB family antitoxin [Chloroflexi bacterium]|nr:type II toxin-antitoxin system HicB family antitoxin [Chloroflexota bacterium]